MPYESPRALARAIVEKYGLQPTLVSGLADYICNRDGRLVGMWGPFLEAIGCHIEEGIVLDDSKVPNPLPDVDRSKLPEKYRCPGCVRLRRERDEARKKLEAAEKRIRFYEDQVRTLAKTFGVVQPPPAPIQPPLPLLETPEKNSEPCPGKNHNVPCGEWKSLNALANAIAEKYNGGRGGAGLAQVLRNDWNAEHRNWRHAGKKWRETLVSIGIVFDSDGFVADCSGVPCPLL